MKDLALLTPLTYSPFFGWCLSNHGHAPIGFSSRIRIQAKIDFKEVSALLWLYGSAAADDTTFTDPPVTHTLATGWFPSDIEFLIVLQSAMPGPL